jgi:hypothetical protein
VVILKVAATNIFGASQQVSHGAEATKKRRTRPLDRPPAILDEQRKAGRPLPLKKTGKAKAAAASDRQSTPKYEPIRTDANAESDVQVSTEFVEVIGAVPVVKIGGRHAGRETCDRATRHPPSFEQWARTPACGS